MFSPYRRLFIFKFFCKKQNQILATLLAFLIIVDLTIISKKYLNLIYLSKTQIFYFHKLRKIIVFY